jgi:hypothetical protein
MGQQLSRDPTQRLDPNGVLGHAAMNEVGVGSDAVHDFVPFVARMAGYHNEIQSLTTARDNYQDLILKSRPLNATEQATVDDYDQQIAAVNQKIQAFTPAFDQAKQTALGKLNTLQMQAALDDMDAL